MLSLLLLNLLVVQESEGEGGGERGEKGEEGGSERVVKLGGGEY